MYQIEKANIICQCPTVGWITIKELVIKDGVNKCIIKDLKTDKKYVIISKSKGVFCSNVVKQDFIIYQNDNGMAIEILRDVDEEEYVIFDHYSDETENKIRSIMEEIFPKSTNSNRFKFMIDSGDCFLNVNYNKNSFINMFIKSVKNETVLCTDLRGMGVTTFIKALHEEFGFLILAHNFMGYKDISNYQKKVFRNPIDLRGKRDKDGKIKMYVLVDDVSFYDIIELRKMDITPIGIIRQPYFI